MTRKNGTSKRTQLNMFLELRNHQQLKSIDSLEKKLHYHFKDSRPLLEGLTHSSAAREFNFHRRGATKVNPGANLTWNERLEFLGDSVLNLAMATLLMSRSENFSEGDLSKIRASLVSEQPLSDIARKLKLGDYILLGKSEGSSGGRTKESILADTLEAVIGAIYLDGGFDKAFNVVKKMFAKHLKMDPKKLISRDSKSQLQEFIQERYRLSPVYELISESGPAHDRSFEIAVKVNGQTIAVGKGGTKKKASQEAAKQAFDMLLNEVTR